MESSNTLLDNNKLTNLILMQSVVVVLLGPIEYYRIYRIHGSPVNQLLDISEK